jgi:predicted DNA-binding transcriptional regulator AlpA
MTSYLPAQVVAEKIGLKTSTLAKWRRSKVPTGPQGWVRVSATRVSYPVENVEAWIEERKRTKVGAFGGAAA